MNRDCPKIISDETLYKKVFKYDSSAADSRYFRQRIVDFLKGATEGKSFSQFMFHAVWEKNGQGQTLKYCFFDEGSQQVKLDHHFYEWMTRTIRRAEVMLNSVLNDAVSDTTDDDSKTNPDPIK